MLSATATDKSGNKSTATVNVNVSNPLQTPTCFVFDTFKTSVHGKSSVTATFSDSLPGELVLAFVGSDGPSTGTQR